MSGIEYIPYRPPNEAEGQSDDAIIVPLQRRESSKKTMEATIEVYDRIRNGLFSAEPAELMIKRLQSHTDIGVLRSIAEGQVVRDVVKTAPVLKVGLSFLDGPNSARIN